MLLDYLVPGTYITILAIFSFTTGCSFLMLDTIKTGSKCPAGKVHKVFGQLYIPFVRPTDILEITVLVCALHAFWASMDTTLHFHKRSSLTWGAVDRLNEIKFDIPYGTWFTGSAFWRWARRGYFFRLSLVICTHFVCRRRQVTGLVR